jgi:hypothetical protein
MSWHLFRNCSVCSMASHISKISCHALAIAIFLKTKSKPSAFFTTKSTQRYRQHFTKMILTDLIQPDFCQPSRTRSDTTLVSVEGDNKAAFAAAAMDNIEPESEPSKPTKKVTFKNSLRLRKIASYRTYSKVEHKACWYSRSECTKQREAASKTSKKMQKGVNVDKDGKDCSRGLEFKSAESHRRRETKRLDIIWTVLGEQDDMIDMDEEVDHEEIAQIYSLCCRQCGKEARQRGMEDEAAVCVPKGPRLPAPSHPVFNNSKKTDDIMSLVQKLSMQATVTIKSTRH